MSICSKINDLFGIFLIINGFAPPLPARTDPSLPGTENAHHPADN